MTKGQLFIVKVFIVKVAKLNEPQGPRLGLQNTSKITTDVSK